MVLLHSEDGLHNPWGSPYGWTRAARAAADRSALSALSFQVKGAPERSPSACHIPLTARWRNPHLRPTTKCLTVTITPIPKHGNM